MTTQHRLPYLVALILCVIAINSTVQFHKDVTFRIEQQEQITATRTAWNNELVAIQPLVEAWRTTLPPTTALIDQFRIIQHIDAPSLGLALNESGLYVGEPAYLSYSGQQIGLLRYPVSNQGQNLSFTALDFTTAWQALAALQARPDIRYSRAFLETHDGKLMLSLENFAVIARIEP